MILYIIYKYFDAMFLIYWLSSQQFGPLANTSRNDTLLQMFRPSVTTFPTGLYINRESGQCWDHAKRVEANVRANIKSNQEGTQHRQHWVQDTEWRQTKQNKTITQNFFPHSVIKCLPFIGKWVHSQCFWWFHVLQYLFSCIVLCQLCLYVLFLLVILWFSGYPCSIFQSLWFLSWFPWNGVAANKEGTEQCIPSG